jgi:TPP-dependent pyruvate/acetoin dehydrogenase alpha subunit
MTAEEIKETEKRIRKEVQKEVLKAKESPRPDAAKGLVEDIYAASLTPYDGTHPPFIRMPDMAKSYYF